MPRTIKQYGREIEANNETLLTIGALAEYLSTSRSSIDRDIARGYALKYGNRTTAAHYLSWLTENPVPPRRRPAAQLRLERELQKLR